MTTSDVTTTSVSNNKVHSTAAKDSTDNTDKDSKFDRSSKTKENGKGENNESTDPSKRIKNEKEYTEIERIEVPSLSAAKSKPGYNSGWLQGGKNETSTDAPSKSGQSSDDEDESSATTSSDSFSECSESSNEECAKIDFEEEGTIEDHGTYIRIYNVNFLEYPKQFDFIKY